MASSAWRLIIRLPAPRALVSSKQLIYDLQSRFLSTKVPEFHHHSPCVKGNKKPPLEDFDLGGNLNDSDRKKLVYQTFPCITQNPSSGSEPLYNKIFTGYEVYNHNRPFKLKYNQAELENLQIAYETWGTLNADKSNVVLLHTPFSESSHARSHPQNDAPGWWEKFIGSGGPVDSDRFFVICTNSLGGCYGSTGPSSIDPRSGRHYGTNFPVISVEDMVRAQFQLLDHLGIDSVYACVGGSLGGIQSLAAAAMYPDRVRRFISMSSGTSTQPSFIAFSYIHRKCIMQDPNWKHGHYYTSQFPKMGMKLAQDIGAVTYRSEPDWNLRFARKKLAPDQPVTLCPSFVIENYLDYQSEKASVRYDPNSALYISKAMELFDMADDFNSMHDSLSRIVSPALIIGEKTDMLFPVHQQRDLANWLDEIGNCQTTYIELNSLYGHISFLVDIDGFGTAIKGFLEAPVNDD